MKKKKRLTKTLKLSDLLLIMYVSQYMCT